MPFSQALPEAFRVPLFNGSRDNDGRKEPRVFIGEVNVAQLFAKSREQLEKLACCTALYRSAFWNHLNSCRGNTNFFACTENTV